MSKVLKTDLFSQDNGYFRNKTFYPNQSEKA